MNEVELATYEARARAEINGQFKTISELYKALQRYIGRNKLEEALSLTLSYEKASSKLGDMIRTMECDIREGTQLLLETNAIKEKEEFHAEHGGNLFEADLKLSGAEKTIMEKLPALQDYIDSKNSFTFEEFKEEMGLSNDKALRLISYLKKIKMIKNDGDQTDNWITTGSNKD